MGGTYDRRRTDTDAPSQNKHERKYDTKKGALAASVAEFVLVHLGKVLARRVLQGHLEHLDLLHDGERVVLARHCRLAHQPVLDVEQNLFSTARYGVARQAKNDTEQGHRREKEVRTAAVFIVVTRGGFHEYHSVGPGAVCAWQQRCSVGRRPANEGHAALAAIN